MAILGPHYRGRPAQRLPDRSTAQRAQRVGSADGAPRSAAAAAAVSPTATESGRASGWSPTDTPGPVPAAAAAAVPQVLAGKTVAVAGGGPAGMLCAAHLARLGAAVEVFERHDPNNPSSAPPAVWVIVLGGGAQRSIEAAGLNADFGPQWRAEGLVSYPGAAPPRFFGAWADNKFTAKHVAMSTQRGIVAHLRAECERVYGDSVRVRYGLRAVGGDVCAGEVVLEDAAGERTARTFDMVVGADGVESVIRRQMQEQDNSMKVSISQSALGVVCHLVHTDGHPSTFASLSTPSGAPFYATPPGHEGPLPGCITGMIYPARGAARDIDLCAVGMFHSNAEVTLAIAGDAAALARKRPEGELLAALEAAYPRLPKEWLRQAAAALEDRAQAQDLRVRSPRFVTCNKLASGRAVLLGDAAHAVSPNLGMGCNAALQDSDVLARACIAAGGDVEAAAQKYDKDRLPSVHVLTAASAGIDKFVTMRFHGDLFRAVSGLPYFLANVHAWLPRSAPVPAFLKPSFAMRKIFDQEEDWTRLPGLVRGYATKLAAISAAVVVVLVVAAERALSQLLY